MAAPIQVDADKQSAIQAGGTSIVVTKPTNLADDDVLYAFLARDNSSAADAITAPSGWTKLGSSEIDNGTFTAGIYRKVIVTASGEPSNYTWSWGSSEKALAWIVRITGADTTTSEDATPSNNTGNSIAPRCLAVTTVTADTLLLACGGKSDKVVDNWTAPSGMTEFFDLVTTGGGAGTAHCSAGAAEVNQAGIGSTGNKDFTILAIKDWVTFLIVIRPSAGESTTFFEAPNMTATGAVAFSQGLVSSEVHVFTSLGSPAFAKVFLGAKSLTFAALGTVTFSRLVTFSRSFTMSATASVTRINKIGKSFAMSAVGTASNVVALLTTKALAMTATATQVMTKTFIMGSSMLAIAYRRSLSMFSSFFRR